MDHPHFGYITKLTKKTLKFDTLAKSQKLTHEKKKKHRQYISFGQFCVVAKVAMVHRNIYPDFGYKLNMKVIF